LSGELECIFDTEIEMAIMKGQLQLEKKAYHDFLKLWNGDKFRGLRFGQAFYNHFRLHRLADQDQLRERLSGKCSGSTNMRSNGTELTGALKARPG